MFCSTPRRWGRGAAAQVQHCLALDASGAQAVAGMHQGLSTLYRSAQLARCGILFKGYITSCAYLSHLHLCATQIMPVDMWRRMWLFFWEQTLGRQKPQAKVLLRWWCQPCCICNSKLGHIWGAPACISGCDPTLFCCTVQQQKLLKNKKYIMVEFLMGWKNEEN